MRVVVDASTFGAAFANHQGLASRVIAFGIAGRFSILVSEAILAEVRRLPFNPHVAGSKGFDMAAADRIISRLDPLQLSAPLRFPTVRLRDPNDEHVAAFALTADANVILSQDLDL